MAEAFIVAWRRLDEIPDDPVPWLLAVARGALKNLRRAAGRRTALDRRLASTVWATNAVGIDPAEEVGARMALENALTRLSEWDREALLLVAWDGLDNRRAAVVMDCSPATFAVRLHRARRRLIQQLARIETTAAGLHPVRVGQEEGT